MNPVNSFILLVDDHPINRTVLGRQLGELNFSVVPCKNGLEALALWRSRPFSLIITDCDMPEMDGYALTTAIRAIEIREELSCIPIIAWTANILPEDLEICTKAGMSDFLPKPASHEDLMKLLTKWVISDQTQAAKTSVIRNDELPAAVAADTSCSFIIPEHKTIPVFDPIVLLDMLGDDPKAHRDLIDSFLEETQKAVAELQHAIEAHDTNILRKISHKLKSSARIVGALELAAACEDLEHAGYKKASRLEIQAAYDSFNIAHKRMIAQMTA